MMKLIDKNNNGYISFPEFSKVFKPTMSDDLVSVAQKDSYLPNLQPSKDKNNQNLDKQTKFVETVNDIKRSFEPNHDNRKLHSKPFIFFNFLFSHSFEKGNKIRSEARFRQHVRKLPAPRELSGPPVGEGPLHRHVQPFLEQVGWRAGSCKAQHFAQLRGQHPQ